MKTPINMSASAAVLASAMMFAGEAGAANVIVNGSFQSTSPAGWPGGFATYNYSTDIYYAGAAVNANDDPTAGSIYSWNNLRTQVVGDLGSAAGITTASIDAGNAQFSLGSWLAAYTSNVEFPGIELKFYNTLTSGGSQVGSTISFDANDLGGLYNAGWSGTGARPTADTDAKTWTYYQLTGTVPVNTRRAEVRIFNAAGSVAGSPDTYVDSLSLDITAIPEPSSGIALAAGVLALGLRRRRR